MTMHTAGFGALESPIFSRLETMARVASFDRPTLILDIEKVAENYRALAAGLGRAHIHYAVKANPHTAVIARLVDEGAHFDAASKGEIQLCLSEGARKPEHISFGNTVKKGGRHRLSRGKRA